jgi:hypothetical protein
MVFRLFRGEAGIFWRKSMKKELTQEREHSESRRSRQDLLEQ